MMGQGLETTSCDTVPHNLSEVTVSDRNLLSTQTDASQVSIIIVADADAPGTELREQALGQLDRTCGTDLNSARHLMPPWTGSLKLWVGCVLANVSTSLL